MKKTSITAHNAIKPSKHIQHEKIIKAMKRLRKGGNYYRIAQVAGMEPIQVARRLSELVACGQIAETNELSLSPSNRPCTVYVLNKRAA